MNNCIIYSKKFNSLYEGFEELTKYVPYVAKYFDIKKYDKDVNETVIINELITLLKDNLPVIDNPDYPYTYSFKCDTHGITFDTDKRFSFGWKSIRTDDGAFFIMRAFFPIRNTRSTSEHNLMNDGWREYTHIRLKKTKVEKIKVEAEEEAKNDSTTETEWEKM